MRGGGRGGAALHWSMRIIYKFGGGGREGRGGSGTMEGGVRDCSTQQINMLAVPSPSSISTPAPRCPSRAPTFPSRRDNPSPTLALAQAITPASKCQRLPHPRQGNPECHPATRCPAGSSIPFPFPLLKSSLPIRHPQPTPYHHVALPSPPLTCKQMLTSVSSPQGSPACHTATERPAGSATPLQPLLLQTN